MHIQKLKLGQQNNDEGSINLAGANKKATLKCKKIIIKTLAKLYQSVYCHSKSYTQYLSASQKQFSFNVLVLFMTKRCVNSNISANRQCRCFFVTINEHSPMKHYLFEMS